MEKISIEDWAKEYSLMRDRPDPYPLILQAAFDRPSAFITIYSSKEEAKAASDSLGPNNLSTPERGDNC